MSKFTQQYRQFSITTPLGPDKLLLSALHGTEAMSRLFSFDLTLLSEDPGITFQDIIGKSVTVSLELASGKYRYFNGIISRFSQVSGENASVDATTRVSSYRATLVPKLWLLTRSADSKIFQNKSVPEIVESVLKDNSITDYELKLQGTYSPREYCVQYRETHFNFISRLLEEEGIHYFFEHKDSAHRLIIADSPQANVACPGQKSASYQVAGSNDDDVIHSLGKTQEIRPNKYALCDFNFKTPTSSLRVDIPGKYKLAPFDRELYDYPGDYGTKAAGDKIVRVRIEEEEAQVTTISGTGAVQTFTAGFRFTLKNFYRKEMNDKDFILTSVGHNLTQSLVDGGSNDYGNSFTCIPADVPFRPPRVTPKPLVQGVQTAIVAGPSGEEIYTDMYGRVKVQFHWDRVGQRNDSSSCWIRVAQAWAGKQWGTLFIPRTGQEVIVDFIEGDPDRPLITGSVYHAVNMPPYSLPAEKTKSTVKTNSSAGGNGFNEIRFEDKKGEEQLFLSAEKDMDVNVTHDFTEWIGNERHCEVTKDQFNKIGGDAHLEVTGDQNEKIGGTASLTTTQDLVQKVGTKHVVDAGMEIYLKAGMKVVIEAGLQLTLKAGASFIDIGPAGVAISGAPLVMINSGGSAGAGSSASPGTPKPPKKADKSKTGSASQQLSPPTPPSAGSLPSASSLSSQLPSVISPPAASLIQAAQSGAPFCCASCL